MWKLGFKCIECGKTFEAIESVAKADKSRSYMYCSHECYAKTRARKRLGGIVTCETCQKDFFVTAARIRQTARNGNAIRFCSQRCYVKTGESNPFWGKRHNKETVVKWMAHPNRHIFPEGRNNPNYKRFEYDPNKRKHPGTASRIAKYNAYACSRCGWDLERSILQIHHRDRNPENNSKNNLEALCPNCHEMEHFLAKDGRWRSTKKPRRPPPVTYMEL